MAALDLGTGAILWQTIMTPEGFPGNAVWGSSPAIDAKRGQLYIATGNNYDAPQETLDCITRAGGDPVGPAGVPPGRQPLRLGAGTRLEDGRHSVGDADAWLRRLDGVLHLHRRREQLSRTGGTRLRLRAGAGAVHREGRQPLGRRGGGRPEERPVLDTQPGHRRGSLGDAGWSGWDRRRPAVGLRRRRQADLHREPEQQPHSVHTPRGRTTTTEGVWSGIDAVTGQLLWQTPNPEAGSLFGGGSSGPVTTANGVVFGCTLDATGHMYALNGATGHDPLELRKWRRVPVGRRHL